MILMLFSLTPFTMPHALASPQWSTEVHHLLIRSVFERESEDCLLQMEAGSDWVDRPTNQGAGTAFEHAMRSDDETREQARTRMARFIRSEYEIAAGLQLQASAQSPGSDADPLPLLQLCFHRGVALHPVMDITSPAHEGFQIWSPFDFLSLLRHGSLPGSIENIDALLASPKSFDQTAGLMRMVDAVYLKLGFRDFLFDGP
jgi:hypothetical protein